MVAALAVYSAARTFLRSRTDKIIKDARGADRVRTRGEAAEANCGGSQASPMPCSRRWIRRPKH